MRSDREAGDTAAPLLQALKAMPAWVTWERDGGGRLGFVSPECKRVTGYPAAAFLAEPGLHLRIVRDDDRELFEAARAAAGEEGSTARYRIVTAHGFERWIESTWRAVPEARDPGPEVVAEHRDVTVSMARLQEAERDSEVLAASPAVAFHWQAAPGWPVTYVSTNVRRWGYAPDEFTTGSLLYAEVLHPDDLERVRREVEKNLGAGVDEYLQRYRVRFASGQYRWVDDATSVARDQHGAVLHLRGIVLDVDAQVRTTRALEESEARFRRLAEHAPDLIYRFEYWPERGFTFVSKAATAITGYSPEEHYSDPDLGFKLVHPDDRSLLEAAVRGDIPAGEPLRLRWVRKDGRIVWTEQRNVPVLDDAGRLVAIEGIARDVSAAARNEADLRRWADVFRHTRVGVVTSTRGEDTLDLVNPAFAEMHGDRRRGAPWFAHRGPVPSRGAFAAGAGDRVGAGTRSPRLAEQAPAPRWQHVPGPDRPGGGRRRPRPVPGGDGARHQRVVGGGGGAARERSAAPKRPRRRRPRQLALRPRLEHVPVLARSAHAVRRRGRRAAPVRALRPRVPPEGRACGTAGVGRRGRGQERLRPRVPGRGRRQRPLGPGGRGHRARSGRRAWGAHRHCPRRDGATRGRRHGSAPGVRRRAEPERHRADRHGRGHRIRQPPLRGGDRANSGHRRRPTDP
jgi:PAS domain S-box-containing protein